MNRWLFCLVAMVLALADASAAPTPGPVRAEIDALLAKLQASGCEFKRNGTWYSGAEARAHLLRKLEYIEGRSTLQSAEQFIEQAASSSSASGRPYQVRCGAAPAVKSQQWLGKELAVIRSSAGRRGQP